MENTFYARDREEWRSWLSEHGSSAPVVWLLFTKKHTGRKCIGYDESVEEALCFGWVDGLIRAVDKDTYARRFSPRQRKSPWSPLNRERALEMIRSGRMTEAGMEAVETARQNGTWYAAPRQVEMPEELEEELDRNSEAAMFFAELAPSYRKSYMGWVDSAKRPETRRKRAREAAELLAKRMKLPMK